MKKCCVVAALLLMAAGCTSVAAPFSGADIDDILGEGDSPGDKPGPRQPSADDLYDPARMPIYKITLEPAAEEQLTAEPRMYVAGELELIDSFGSERVHPVGPRLGDRGGRDTRWRPVHRSLLGAPYTRRAHAHVFGRPAVRRGV